MTKTASTSNYFSQFFKHIFACIVDAVKQLRFGVTTSAPAELHRYTGADVSWILKKSRAIKLKRGS